MVCDKVQCERGCVKDGVSEMVHERWNAKDGGPVTKLVCERWCMKDCV